MARSQSSYQRIYAVVRRIPCGRVATYGQIAELAGIPGQARQVGYALSALAAGSAVPWHRVLNARGEISLRRASSCHITQRILLEHEKVEFDPRGRVELWRFRWKSAGGAPSRMGSRCPELFQVPRSPGIRCRMLRRRGDGGPD